MAQFSESGVNSKLFTAVMVLLGLGLFGSWFFLHPNSPWHTRNTYTVGFAQVGSLKAGDAVMVNGLKKGTVESTELTDTCVWVRMRVLAAAPVPRDSRFYIENAGLMGERVVNVRLGREHIYMENGDSISPGAFDQGSTSIGVGLAHVLGEVGGILSRAEELLDTIASPERIQDYKRMAQKMGKIGKQAPRIVNSTRASLRTTFGNLSATAEKLDSLAQLAPELQDLVRDAKALASQAAALEGKLQETGQAAKQVAASATGESTVGLILQKDGALQKELKNLSENAEKLLEKIKRRGLDMNVDIF